MFADVSFAALIRTHLAPGQLRHVLRRLLLLTLGLGLLRDIHLGNLVSLIVLDLADELGPLCGSVVQGHGQVRSEVSGGWQGLFILTHSLRLASSS